MEKIEKGSLVCVTWVDADSDAGWQPHNPIEDDRAEPMESYGLFVSKGHKFITLSHCHNKEADEWLGKHRIPIAFIEGIKKIKK